MAPAFPAGILIAVVLFPVAAVFSSSPAGFILKRGIPATHRVETGRLRERDRVRHSRMLQSSGGVVDFPVRGTFDPFLVGLYYAKLQLGTPPKDFYVQIDTGSDVLWVSCRSCNGCPVTSGLQIPLNFFDPGSSPTASLISCSDQRCGLGTLTSDTTCSPQNNQCCYQFQYGDGSGTTGYYVSDLLHFDTVVGGSAMNNSSAQVVFGCSTSQTGDLMTSDRAVDGIFGFGQQSMSVISQLASQGLAPRAFSHCLKGDDAGGGILVFGEIVEPNIVYSPLVQSQPHYNLNLVSISVNGTTLAIDPSVFGTSSSGSQGTIIDSGTTLAYLAEGAFDPFVNAITSIVSQSVTPYVSKGNQCFLLSMSASASDIFPQVTLNFAGGASMFLRPQDYMLQQNSDGGAAEWCMGFQKVQGQQVTILGGKSLENLFHERVFRMTCDLVLPGNHSVGFADLILKDKIIVYDIDNQRIGWTNYDCSTTVNVTTTLSTGKSEYVNAGTMSSDSSQQDALYSLLLSLAILVHTFLPHRSYCPYYSTLYKK